jgi:hypothetical protein
VAIPRSGFSIAWPLARRLALSFDQAARPR